VLRLEKKSEHPYAEDAKVSQRAQKEDKNLSWGIHPHPALLQSSVPGSS
jgi:hypothetical protein